MNDSDFPVVLRSRLDGVASPPAAGRRRGREGESDDEVMPTRKKRGYVTLSDRPPPKPSETPSSDDEVMPTKRPRGPPKRRGN